MTMKNSVDVIEMAKKYAHLKNLQFGDDVLLYFNSRLNKSDLYFLLLITHQTLNNGTGLFSDFLSKHSDKLLYTNRQQMNALIRLEAMGLINKSKKGRLVYYSLTINGKRLYNIRRHYNDTQFQNCYEHITWCFGKPK